MAARLQGGVKITATDWDDAVQTTGIPLVETGNARITYNSADNTWDFYLNGAKIAALDVDGNLRIKGEVSVLQTF